MTWDFDRIANGIKDAVFEPDTWPNVLETIGQALNGSGVILFGHRGDVPLCSRSMEESRQAYLSGGWCEHDYRYSGVDIMLRQGIVTDEDILPSAERRKLQFYHDLLKPWHCDFFAGVGFMTGDDFWCMSVQRGGGRFEESDLSHLKMLWRPLADAATLSRQFGRAETNGLLQGLDAIPHAAMLLDGRGRFLRCNETAQGLVGRMIDPSDRMFRSHDPQSTWRLDRLVSAALAEEPVADICSHSATILDDRGRRLVVRAIAVSRIFRTAFPQARVLLLIKPLEVDDRFVRQCAHYRLTPSESQFLRELTAGHSVRRAAKNLGITYETARTRLKTIFHKTSTHRQGELIVLFGTEGKDGV